MSTAPNGLPKCKIVESLREKANRRDDIDVDFEGMLNDFRKVITGEVLYINQLFPEYTPHDAYYHLRQLFFIADKLLGDDLIHALNSTELLILSLSLYGHDWGMAVSEVEKELIITGEIRNGHNLEDYALLRDENKSYKEFLKENNVEYTDSVKQSIWQNYVRNTHALRSGARVRHYFKNIDPGLGEAVARVCEGHWIDVFKIQFSSDYSIDYTVLKEIVNLKALAIYLRLTDLMDISYDRTPYVIWKYVAPIDPISQLEWKKHKAINSIDFPPFQSGRKIKINGSTDDYIVYANLVDFVNWCSTQLKGCNDVLNQINEPRYNLNIFEFDWGIKAIGFKPISIQFEFDRNKTFDILSDEIYKGDKYVFLRELLQNSIDAIKIRKKLFEKQGLNADSFGLIEIDVDHKNNGDAIIKFADNGIGMDEYIVKNYLSVAGKSFYSSEDYKKLGLNIDPISKFGVGVLSCFMVADRIEIETYRDQMISFKSEQLKIQIPSVSKQFRIESTETKNATVGTTFIVYVSGSKLNDETLGAAVSKLAIVDYISKIAGFVDFPIKITEDGKTTLIINNSIPLDDCLSKFGQCNILKKQINFPWEQAFLPQNLKSAKKIFKEVVIDINVDLGLEGASGKMIVLEPIKPDTTLFNEGRSWPSCDYFVLENTHPIQKHRIRFKDNWSSYYHEPDHSNEFSQSSIQQETHQVYLDGILVPQAGRPVIFHDDNFHDNSTLESPGLPDKFLLPYFIVNFSKLILGRVDLSRTESLKNKKDANWSNILYDKYIDYLSRERKEAIMRLPSKDKLISIANLVIFNRLAMQDIDRIFCIDLLCVPIFRKGQVVFEQWGAFKNSEVYIQPENVKYFYDVFSNLFNVDKSEQMLDKTKINDFILISTLSKYASRHHQSAQSRRVCDIIIYIINYTHNLNSITFFKDSTATRNLKVQQLWAPKKDISIDYEEQLRNISYSSKNITYENYAHILHFLRNHKEYTCSIRFDAVPFKVMNTKLAYKYRYLNFHHPTVQLLIAINFAVCLAKSEKIINSAILGLLTDEINDLPFSRYEGDSQKDLIYINNKLSAISKIVNESNLLKKNIKFAKITEQSFVELPDRLL